MAEGSSQPSIAAPRETRASLAHSVGVVGSLLAHAGVFALISYVAMNPPEVKKQESVEFLVVEQPKPPEPPPPPPEPPKEEPKPEPVKPKPVKVARVLPPPPKDAPPPPPQLKEVEPPPPNETPPPDAKPNAPVLVGISMTSTSTAGGFAAPVGNTLYGATARVAPKPEEVKPYASATGRYVPPYKVSTLPELVGEVKAPFPEEARKLGMEGEVLLKLTIDATGKVVAARVLKGAGYGFDEAALQAVKKFRFKPGTEGGEAIITEINYTYTFLLD
ncbi:MAG: energy transducer TonB [Myxococcales bacterium]